MGNETKFDAVCNLSDIEGDPDAFEQLLAQADEAQQKRFWDDPEWAEPQHIHLKDIVRAFAVGVINADAWFAGYSLPPNFETVLNALAGAVVSKFGADEIAHVSLLDLEAFWREFIDATPLCREWNDFPGETFVSRYSGTPNQRTFIGLDALVRNASIHVRDDRREFNRFNAEFDAKYGQLST